MSEKFTPGPWEADFIDRDYPSGDFDYWEVYCVPEDRALCDVHGALDRDAANAALIAAAPDMYEALEYIHSELVVKTDGENYAYHMIEAALKKARGEAV